MLKSVLKQLLPSGLLTLWQRYHATKAAVYFSGEFSSWDLFPPGGYDNVNIAEKVLTATQAVIDNRAQYERDSVLFDDNYLAFPLLCSMQDVILRNQGKLNVIDFGGSLGSTFWQYQKYLLSLTSQIEWHVIEQPLFIETSKLLKYNAPLFFYSSLDNNKEIIKNANMVLFSSVLQFLPNYEYFLGQMTSVKNIIIDRTPEFIVRKDPQLTMQYVKEPIYDAKYGMRVFGHAQLMDEMCAKGYERKFAWRSPVDPAQSLKNTQGEYNDFACFGALYVKK